MQTFLAWLERNNLYYTFNLPISTSVANLIGQIATVMQNSSSYFSFVPTASCLSFASNEVLPLQLLSLSVGRQQQFWCDMLPQHLSRQPMV